MRKRPYLKKEWCTRALEAPLRVGRQMTSVESREVSEGVVLDYDAAGNLVGIDIDNASTKVQLDRLVLSRLPAEIETIVG